MLPRTFERVFVMVRIFILHVCPFFALPGGFAHHIFLHDLVICTISTGHTGKGAYFCHSQNVACFRLLASSVCSASFCLQT